MSDTTALALASVATFAGRVTHADARTLLASLPDACVQLIAIDPPYNMRKAEWDTFDSDAALVAWLGEHFAAMRRVLAPNGSVYVFTAPEIDDLVSVEIRKYFNVLNRIQWVKDGGWHKRASKEALRSFLSPRETIIFAEHYNSDNMARGESSYVAKCDELRGFVFEPLREYLERERLRAGITFEQVRQMVGCAPGSGLPSHWFTRSQWALPTEENYLKLREGFNREGKNGREYLRRDYKDLRRDYKDLRRDYEDLRRPFNLTATDQFADVWFFKPVAPYPGKHPAEKPLDLMRHIVRASSRPGDLVLDCFAGSGTTLRAAHIEKQRYIGGDSDVHWCAVARRKLAEPLSARVLTAAEQDVSDLPLFALVAQTGAA